MGKKVFVGNLSFQTSENDLFEMFAKIGRVESVQIIAERETARSKGFAFVEMGDDAAAVEAIERFSGQELDGRILTVNEARPMERRDHGTSHNSEAGRLNRRSQGTYDR